MDLLTPTVNVPAERAKLRRLRDEIHAEAQARLAYERKYTARGYVRMTYVADAPITAPAEAKQEPKHEMEAAA